MSRPILIPVIISVGSAGRPHTPSHASDSDYSFNPSIIRLITHDFLFICSINHFFCSQLHLCYCLLKHGGIASICCSPSVSHLNLGVLVPTVSLLSVEYDTSSDQVAGDVAVRMFELIVNSELHKLSLEVRSLSLPSFTQCKNLQMRPKLCTE